MATVSLLLDPQRPRPAWANDFGEERVNALRTYWKSELLPADVVAAAQGLVLRNDLSLDAQIEVSELRDGSGLYLRDDVQEELSLERR
jgi:hypothetical protein